MRPTSPKSGQIARTVNHPYMNLWKPRRGEVRSSEVGPAGEGRSAGSRLDAAGERSETGRSVVVMKFGGTSVGDASCIRKAAAIIQEASIENCVVVVVSAMSGVTDHLIEFAVKSAAGEAKRAKRILERVRKRHKRAIGALVHCRARRRRLSRKVDACLLEGERACHGVRGEMTPQAMDLISSLGERLSAPLLAAALTERGVASEAVEATEILMTDGNHGNAEPDMALTRECTEARLRPLLSRGVVPVVTGFLGATPDGVVTTLGRGGSDYSATIFGAVLDAKQITLWTDVDGVLSADPRWVAEAIAIPEICYGQAARLAFFGAKVLHPKTLRAVRNRNLPVWIRNTFASHRAGTRIDAQERRNGSGVKALATVPEAVLVEVCSGSAVETREWIQHVRAALASAAVDVYFVSRTAAESDLRIAVHGSHAVQAIAAIRKLHLPDSRSCGKAPITLDRSISVLTIVGAAAGDGSGLAKRAIDVMRRKNVGVMASAVDDSDCSFSMAVAREEMKKALVALHREFHLEAHDSKLRAGTGSECSSHGGLLEEGMLLGECGP